VPPLIRYQGTAVDTQGVPLEGPYTLKFRLYPSATGGTAAWTETHDPVPIDKGHFAVLLGSVAPLTAMDWTQPCWLSVQVNGEPELSPRQQITSVPTAIVADKLATPVATSDITDDDNALVPTGAVILWDGASCPTGYTRLSAYDNRFLRASATAGQPGGADTHDHGASTGSHALAIAEMPSHMHGQVGSPSGGGNWNRSVVGQDWNGGGITSSHQTAAAGGGQGHSHTIASADSRPAFMTILLCKKD
jgi:hypothetical protein